jgi:MFS family permease
MSPKKGSLFVIFLTVFIDLLGFGMVLPLLPIYAQSFVHDNYGLVIGGLMASFSAMQFLFAPFWGRLSDRIGRRPVLMVGLAGSVVFYTLFGLATVWENIVLLFIARIGAGIAGATIPTAQAYIADTTTLETRTKGMALIGMAFGLGFTLGPLLGLVAIKEKPPQAGLNNSAAVAPSDASKSTTAATPPVQRPSPGPGYVAAGLSGFALLLAVFLLPESLAPGSASAAKKLLDTRALADALSVPSIGALLSAYFICVFAFGNFETTLSMMINGEVRGSPFHFTYEEVFYTFAYIGLVLTVAQGLIVRRLSGKVHEGILAAVGGVLEIVGFGLMMMAIDSGKVGQLRIALTVIVCGFAMMMPTLMSLVSRRSDPTKQGGILGLGQSIAALARIFGPLMGVPLLKLNIKLPYEAGAGLMAVGLAAIVFAARRGHDYGTARPAAETMMEM